LFIVIIFKTYILIGKGELGLLCCANKKMHGFIFIGRASPASRVKNSAPIVLAQHKEHERIGEA
jgi:hypothetical protein